MSKLLIARYALDDAVHYGVVEGDVLKRFVGQPFDGLQESGHRDPMSQVKLLAPVATAPHLRPWLQLQGALAGVAEGRARPPGTVHEAQHLGDRS